jgi:hypothetical protein
MSKENETKLPVREVGYQKKNSKVIKMWKSLVGKETSKRYGDR